MALSSKETVMDATVSPYSESNIEESSNHDLEIKDSKMATHVHMGTKKILPLILNISLPSVLSYCFLTLYATVDSSFIGQFEGVVALSGISAYLILEELFSMVFQSFAIVTASIISHSLGANKKYDAHRAFTYNLALNVVFSLIIIAIQLPFLDSLLLSIGVTSSALPITRPYAIIVSIGNIGYGIIFALENAFRAENSPWMALLLQIISTCMNMTLDFVFMKICRMGTAGAALSTLISQFVPGIIFLIFFIRKSSPVTETKISLSTLKCDAIDWSVFSKILWVGLGYFLLMANAFVAGILMNQNVKKWATNDEEMDIWIGALGVFWRLYVFVYFPCMGFSSGFLPIASYNKGKGRYDRVFTVLWECIVITAVVAIILSSFCLIFTVPIVGLFNDDPEFRAITEEVTRWGFYPLFGMSFILMPIACYTFEHNTFAEIFLGIVNAIPMFVFVYVCPMWTQSVDGFKYVWGVSMGMVAVIGLPITIYKMISYSRYAKKMQPEIIECDDDTSIDV
ncbi:Multi antimicrobial extrusion protein like protein [Aduncisulcus paluster]|uniref:Multi antimicrobial extrusion protein like protein n=1 Tax=Aduncisulcus paluster TaxID=2918883 RepID=A0ABQ5JSF0_9EUKA|nr:Multi antimicrobial extrusion protein like protein [Aduncisulcus paluster]